MKYLMGIDSGTQSTKVSIFDEAGNVVCDGKQALKPMYCPKPGVAEHPDDDLWEALKGASKEAMANFKGDVKDIVGIGLCSIRCCRVLLKKDYSLAHNVISWMDMSAGRPYEDKEGVAYVCQTSGYLTHRLTGEYKDTAANYEVSWPFDWHTWNWSKNPEDFKKNNLTLEMLPELKNPGEILGYITKEAAAATGLPEGIPVVATANDKGTETLGTGIMPIAPTGKSSDGILGKSQTEEGTIVLSLGTYISALAVGYDYLDDDEDFWSKTSAASFWTTTSCVPGLYMYESMTGIRRGMWMITWAKDILNIDSLIKANGENMSGERYLDLKAEEVPAGCDGLMVILDWLPKPTGKHKRGMMIGFDERHTQAHIYRAILEAITITMYNNMDPMYKELNIKNRKVLVSGGGSNSNVFMQIISDVFGCPAVRNVNNGAAGVGSAICVAVATGIQPDFKTAVSQMVKIKDSFEPDMKNHKLYMDMREIYSTIPDATDEVLQKSHKLFGEQ